MWRVSEGAPSDDGGRVVGGSANFIFTLYAEGAEALRGRSEGGGTLPPSTQSVTLLTVEAQVTMYG